MINFLLSNIFDFHRQLGTDATVLSRGLIESAVNAPFQSFGGQDLYPTVLDKAARLGFGLAKNHGFADGNKRVALHAMELFLLLHNIRLVENPHPSRFKAIMNVADGSWDTALIKNWLAENSRRYPSLLIGGEIIIRFN